MCSFTVSSDDSRTSYESPAASEIALIRLPKALCRFSETVRCVLVLSTSGALAVRPWWSIWQQLTSPQWCAIITVPDVALFHSHFTTDLHLTIDPADFKVPLSSLHGWWTPHPSSFTWHEHCSVADVRVRPWGQSPLHPSSSFPDTDCRIFNYSRCWIMLFSVFIWADPDRWSLSEGWEMAQSVGDGMNSIGRLCHAMFGCS